MEDPREVTVEIEDLDVGAHGRLYGEKSREWGVGAHGRDRSQQEVRHFGLGLWLEGHFGVDPSPYYFTFRIISIVGDEQPCLILNPKSTPKPPTFSEIK